MLKKIFKYVFIAIVIASLISIITFFKPVTTFFIESYASNMLQQKVRVSSLSLTNYSIEAYIQEPKNKIVAKLIRLSPLKIEASFRGDIDAFKKYHTLRGDAKVDANISYSEKLIVEAEGSLYKSTTKVEVKELDSGWFVSVDAKGLDLQDFKKKNSLEFNLDGVVNFKLSKENREFKLRASLLGEKVDSLKVDAEGLFEDAKISASTSLAYGEKRVHLDRVFFDMTTHQATISSKDFGGDLELFVNAKTISLDAKALHLQKILDFIEHKEIVNGVVDIKGEFDTKSKKAKLLLFSPKLDGFKQELRDVKLNIPSLHLLNKELTLTYSLNTTFLEKAFSFDGKLFYKDKLNIFANSSDFNSKSSFELDDKKIRVSIKSLDIEELLEFLEQKPLASGTLNLEAGGTLNKFAFKLDSDAKLDRLDAKIGADGFFITETKELNSKFSIFTKLGKESLRVDGDAYYKEEFKVDATSSSFGANSRLLLRDGFFEFYTKGLEIQELAKAFDKPNLPIGRIDFLASGDSKEIALNIRSQELRRNMLLYNIDNYISFDLHGSYKDEVLSIKDRVNLHHKSKKLPLVIDAKISLKAPYESKGSLRHGVDKIVVDSFSFEDEQIRSNFEVDIDELNLYKAVFNTPLYGPLNIDASYDSVLNIKSSTFGGELHLILNKNLVILNIDMIEAKKLAYLFSKNTSLKSGTIDGVAKYDTDKKSANTDIALRDATLSGVSIDRRLKELDDLLGLNVVNMSKSILSHYYNEQKQETKISQLQLDLSLKDKDIKLEDIALKTEEFLIVAQGELEDNGDIKRVDISIVDRNGCAIVTQALSGNIKAPKIANTTSTLVNIVQSVPTSILKSANKLVDFGAGTIDGIASFGLNTILRRDANLSMTSDLVSMSRSISKFSSDMIAPGGCKVIYSGKVKHPANSN